MDRVQKSSPGRRRAGSEGQAGREAKPTPDEATADAREAREHEVAEKFLTASAPMFNVVVGRLEEARREGAEFFLLLRFDFGLHVVERLTQSPQQWINPVF